ncbi:MAG: acyltransferase [Clostridia bacterium]|nr:acyltransferase [Clostridia bacterium]MBQ7051627.1 acyltransferase [Clostridia bacterium]
MNATRLLSRYRGALMGFAQLWIVVFHCWLLIVPNRPFLGAVENFIKWNGLIGVDFFFFLSGMGLTYAIRKKTLREFYAGRLRRILVPYWVMLAAHAIHGRWEYGKILRYATGVVFVTEDFQALLWFIPAILVLYALFPAYHALLCRARDKTAATGCMLIVWLCGALLLRETMRSDLWTFYNRLPSFLLGVWFGEAGRERDMKMHPEHWALCLVGVAAGFLLMRAGTKGLVQAIPQALFAGSAFCAVPLCFLLAGLFALLEGGAAGRIARPFMGLLRFVGTFTLELYCCHQWLYIRMYSFLEGRVSYLAINVITIPIVILAGWLFHLAHQQLWICVDRMRQKRA